jgi:hypothetical protein
MGQATRYVSIGWATTGTRKRPASRYARKIIAACGGTVIGGKRLKGGWWKLVIFATPHVLMLIEHAWTRLGIRWTEAPEKYERKPRKLKEPKRPRWKRVRA